MLSEQVYEKLLSMLMTNELMPGELLNRREIAARLNVSVAPVLEALLRLEIEGYVETIPRKGTQVKIIRPDDIIGNLLIKTGIECMAVRGYCGQKIRENYDELLKLATELEDTSASKGPTMEVWSKDMEFHTALVALCGNKTLLEQYKLFAKPGLFFHLNCKCLSYNISERSNHVILLNRLAETDDKDAATAILKEHLFNGKDILANYI